MPSLRQQIAHDEFDYQTLVNCLRDYGRPRDKISDLLRKGAIIRVKKGLYVFGDDFRRGPIVRELLANLIYGPSYLSLEYALAYHGLIPERVETLTSVTCGRSRSFATPIGLFTYHRIPMSAFGPGMDRAQLDDGRSFLIATPETALCDTIVKDRGAGVRTQSELRGYLLDSLRLDPAGLRRLDPNRLEEIAERYRSRKARTLGRLVRQWRRKAEGN